MAAPIALQTDLAFAAKRQAELQELQLLPDAYIARVSSLPMTAKVAGFLGAITSTQLLDCAAGDGHNFGWKASKDSDLADLNNPFVGHYTQRIKVSDEIKSSSKADFEDKLGRQISADKWAAIQAAPNGKDITHPLYLPYNEMLRMQPDGGMRLSGQNALPLLVLTQYLADHRTSEVRTLRGLHRVISRLMDGSDTRGIEALSKNMHTAFSAAQIVHGERGVATEYFPNGQSEPVIVKARDDLLPYTALRADIKALDADALMPAARWLKSKLEEIFMNNQKINYGAPISDETSAIADVMQLRADDLANGISILRAVREANERREKTEEVSSKVQAISSSEVGGKEGKIQALWTFVDSRGVDSFYAQDLSRIFLAFKELGAYQDMIDLYDSSANPAFKASVVLREFLSVALHKTKDYSRSREVVEGLLNQAESGESFAILGKIEKLSYQDYKDQLAALPANSDPAISQQLESLKIKHLEAAIAVLDKGFKIDFEFYPGINLVYNLFSHAKETGDQTSAEKAQAILPLVEIAVEKAGGIASNDFWAVTTLLEVSAMQGKIGAIPSLVARTKSLSTQDWELTETIKNLKSFSEQIAGPLAHLDPLGDTKLAVDLAIRGLQSKEQPQAASLPAAFIAIDKKVEALVTKGFSYGEIKSNFVGGNIDYGGQLHSHTVNRWDLDMARALLRYKGLDNCLDFSKWNKEVDNLIRERFRTADMEDMTSETHHKFDEFMKVFNSGLGALKGHDSRTNVMADFWLRKGDCRQHAYVKQLLFDVWKSDLVNQNLTNAYERIASGDFVSGTKAISAVKNFLALEMISCDFLLSGKVEGSKYKLERSPTGLLIESDQTIDMEEHTLNLIVHRVPNGSVNKVKLVDAFYQNVYEMGGEKSQGLSDGLSGIEIDLDTINDDGSFNIAASSVSRDDMDEVRSIQIKMVPTAYSGDRSKRVKPNGDEYGQVMLRGIVISGVSGTGAKRLDVSTFFDQSSERAVEKFAERVIKETEERLKSYIRKYNALCKRDENAQIPAEELDSAVIAVINNAKFVNTTSNRSEVRRILTEFGSNARAAA